MYGATKQTLYIQIIMFIKALKVDHRLLIKLVLVTRDLRR